jgi:hypothetical protein
MCAFLVLFWCSAVTGQCRERNISRNSRFGVFNSRLGRFEFPVGAATGIGSQGFDLPHGFLRQTVVIWGESKKFPDRREQPGILPAGGNWLPRTLPTAGADLRARGRPTSGVLGGVYNQPVWPPRP